MTFCSLCFPFLSLSPVWISDDSYISRRNRSRMHRLRNERHCQGRDKEVPLVHHQGLLRNPGQTRCRYDALE